MEGTVEIHIDSPYKISCIDIFDDTPNGRGADMRQVDGGDKFVTLEVRGKYGAGLNMKIVVRGTQIESEVAELDEIARRMRDRIASAPKYQA